MSTNALLHIIIKTSTRTAKSFPALINCVPDQCTYHRNKLKQKKDWISWFDHMRHICSPWYFKSQLWLGALSSTLFPHYKITFSAYDNEFVPWINSVIQLVIISFHFGDQERLLSYIIDQTAAVWSGKKRSQTQILQSIYCIIVDHWEYYEIVEMIYMINEVPISLLLLCVQSYLLGCIPQGGGGHYGDKRLGMLVGIFQKIPHKDTGRLSKGRVFTNFTNLWKIPKSWVLVLFDP